MGVSTAWEQLQAHLGERRERQHHAEETVRSVSRKDRAALSTSAAQWLADSYGWHVAPTTDPETWVLRRRSETMLLRSLSPSDPATWHEMEAAASDAWQEGAEGAILIALAGTVDPDLEAEYPNVKVYGFGDLVGAIVARDES